MSVTTCLWVVHRKAETEVDQKRDTVTSLRKELELRAL